MKRKITRLHSMQKMKYNHLLKLITAFFLFSSNLVFGQVKIGDTLLRGINSLTNTKEFSGIETVTVKDQLFTSALKVNTYNIPVGTKEYILRAPVNNKVNVGDVMWLSFKAKCIQSKRESGEAVIEISLDRTVNGKYEWPPILERGISIGAKWISFQIPFIASRNIASGELSFVLKCGAAAQIFEFGDLTLINYEKTTKYSDLPRSVVHYDGDSPDAPWRKAAAERIEKYRKGNLQVLVLNKNGKPVQGASVEVHLKKHSFAWGTASNSSILLDTVSADAKIYRDTLVKYFNEVVLENEMKAKYWQKYDHNKTLSATKWLKQQDIKIRGHVMVWPSWQHSPHLLPLKNDTSALQKSILATIKDQTTVMKGQFTEWDVVNETYNHHELVDLLGNNAMLNWFKAARAGAPGVKLFLNDYTMFRQDGKGSPSETFFENAKFLQAHGAIDAIGEQGHIGSTPPAIEYVIAKLAHFSELGLPIQISEFDITSDDNDFKARYMRDFMTAVFSNPNTIGFVQWGFWEKQHWISASALWDKNWNIKPQGQVFTNLVSNVWSTHEKGITDKDGKLQVRGFNGAYEILIKKGNKVIKKQTKLTAKGEVVTVILDN
ncbi:endo-1,4-beta-xylanase [Pedobacter lithocola]|uniref:Beta-xylanase n=1 Tax=Pedobacter lithocola TaxID=1908239 RepID=A0ABV8PEQ9_9SPHI